MHSPDRRVSLSTTRLLCFGSKCHVTLKLESGQISLRGAPLVEGKQARHICLVGDFDIQNEGVQLCEAVEVEEVIAVSIRVGEADPELNIF